VGLVLDNVSKRVGPIDHITEVSLELTRGSLNVLLGPTLAGKTSLMRLMAGLDAPSSGKVLFDGQDVTGVPVRKRSVAMVYQQFINYPTLTVYENIASPLRVAGKSKAEIDAKVLEAARLLRLEPYLKRTPLELSGGQQQRTALARALVRGADLVLMDEPLANLDYKLREELREELPRLFAASGAILVYATTEATEALLLGGKTATLWEGRVTQYGQTPEIYRHPRDLVTAQVFSDPPLNLLSIEKRGNQAIAAGGRSLALPATATALPDGGYHLGFRAHHLVLAAPSPDALQLSGLVAVSEITGSESYIHADVEGARWVSLSPGVRKLLPGESIDFYVDPNRLFLFEPSGKLVLAPADALAA